MDRQNHSQAAGAGGAYELLPYASMPYATTQPARLAAVAKLHGVNAPAVEHARVLELGCAGGGNLIPLAARFPQAQFLGIDLAHRHIEEGAQRISELGLSNIEMRQADIADLSLRGPFDYIICHGVFSWVPSAVQDAIFRTCQTMLSHDGVAVVSFNVLPGWHLRMAIRDLCLRHTDGEASPKVRVAKARALLAEIAENANASEPYGFLLRKEAERLAYRPASYIMGEFLASHNSPCHVTDFAARAEAFGLAYLCEADLDASVPAVLKAPMQESLAAVAGAGGLVKEQYIDDLTGRTFRSAVLVKENVARRPFDPQQLRWLNVSASVRPVQSGANGSADSSLAGALGRLAAAFPNTLTVPELAADLKDADAEARLCEALSMLVRAGQVELSTFPIVVGDSDAARPRIWAVARREAASGQPWMTSRTHLPVAVQPLTAFLAKHIDGTHDHAALRDLLAEGLRRSEVRLQELEGPDASGEIDRLAALYLTRLLEHLARSALLDPS